MRNRNELMNTGGQNWTRCFMPALLAPQSMVAKIRDDAMALLFRVENTRGVRQDWERRESSKRVGTPYIFDRICFPKSLLLLRRSS